jgi:hypothetical protein
MLLGKGLPGSLITINAFRVGRCLSLMGAIIGAWRYEVMNVTAYQ